VATGSNSDKVSLPAQTPSTTGILCVLSLSKQPTTVPTYAASIESMDDPGGTLLDVLHCLNLADNSAIMIVSDNGCNRYNLVDGASPTGNSPVTRRKYLLRHSAEVER